MATKAELTRRLEALEEIRASGVLRLREGETETVFRTMRELDVAIEGVRSHLARADGPVRRTRMVRMRDRSGW